MLGKLEIVSLANALAGHAAERQNLIARNVANSDTPGFRPADLDAFDPDMLARPSNGLRQTRDAHIGSDTGAPRAAKVITDTTPMSPNGNAVSIEAEMVRAVDARRQHDLALAVYSSAMGVLRTSLGRGR